MLPRTPPRAPVVDSTAPPVSTGRVLWTHYTSPGELFGLLVVTGSAERQPTFALTVEAGIVLLRWTPGVHITGPLAAEAMAAVDRLNADHKRPLLVDMTGTANLARAARAAFGGDCQVLRMAIVGSSPVDKVIANFGLRVSTIAIPSRYFNSVPAALAWLRAHGATPDHP